MTTVKMMGAVLGMLLALGASGCSRSKIIHQAALADDAKAAPEPEGGKAKTIIFSEAASEDGVVARIELAKSKFAAGEPIELTFRLTNKTKAPITIWRRWYGPGPQLWDDDPKPKLWQVGPKPKEPEEDHIREVPLTNYGELRLCLMRNGHRSGPPERFYLNIPVGEEIEFPFSLTRLYDISLASNYRVSLKALYYTPGHEDHSLSLQDLHFSVVEPANVDLPLVWFDADFEPWGGVKSDKEMEDGLEISQNLVLPAKATPLFAALGTIMSGMHGYPYSIMLDPRAVGKAGPLDDAEAARLNAANLEFPLEYKEALQKVLEPRGLKYIVAEEMLFVTDQGRADAVMDPKVPEEAQKSLSGFRLLLEMEDAPFEEAIGLVAKQSRREVSLEGIGEAARRRPVSFISQRMTALHLLNWLCRVNDLTWTVDGKKIILRERKAERYK